MDKITSEADWRYIRCLELRSAIKDWGVNHRMWVKELVEHLEWFEDHGNHDYILLFLDLK